MSGVLAAAWLRGGSTAVAARGMWRNIKSCTRAWQTFVLLVLLVLVSELVVCPQYIELRFFTVYVLLGISHLYVL